MTFPEQETVAQKMADPAAGSWRAWFLDYFFGTGPKHPNRYRILEVGCVVGHFAVSFLIAMKVWDGLRTDPSILWFLPAIGFLAIVGADFVSGMVHWACDTYGTTQTTFVGPKFIKPFREHHDDPKAMTKHDFIEANCDNCFTTLAVLTPTYWSLDDTMGTAEVVFGLYMVVFTFFVLMTSIAHGWAHSDQVSEIIRFMQRKRLFVSPTHHARHHVSPHLDHYCITTGWLNPVLDRIQFFRKCEWVIGLLGYHPSEPRSRIVEAPEVAVTEQKLDL
jgi:plasmanylethanolamine desaturase